jgi:uncharacterized membrane protein YvbJ
MKHCTECGKEINSTDKFCTHCGSPTDQVAKDEATKADVQVEITNATTEKVFKAVGDTIYSGKKAVTTGAKATTSFAKKFMTLIIILVIIGGIGAYIVEQKKQEENAIFYEKRSQQYEVERRIASLEQKNCVIHIYKSNYLGNDKGTNLRNAVTSASGKWDIVKRKCDLSHSEVKNYQDLLGINLEKHRSY